MQSFDRILRAVAFGAVLALALPAAAQAPLTKVRMSLEFRIYGGTAPSILAAERGYFREEGIDIQIDGSSGSGEAITRVAGGAYDVGMADVSAVIEFGSRNAANAPKLVMPVFDTAPHVIIALKSSGITKPSDLVGKRLATGQNDATARILPSFARAVGFDLEKVNRQAVDVRLRETMLLRGDADAVVGFDYTVLFNLLGQGVKREDVVMLDFAANGIDLYGNGLIASADLIAKRPEVVAAVARAVARGWVAAIADPAAAVAAVAKRDALIAVPLETDRLKFVLEQHIITPATKANGIGAFDMAKLERSISLIVEGFELPRRPSADEVYDGRFMPASTIRRFQ